MARGPRSTGGTSQTRLTPITNQGTKVDKDSKKQYGPKPVKIVARQEE